MRVYNLRDRSTGKLLKKKHWNSLGHLKAWITCELDSHGGYWKDKYKNGNMELVIYELVEKQVVPIIENNEFNKLMYLTIEEEKK